MSTRWCCRILHEELGPMDLDELRELASSGTLSSGDLVRRESEDVWAVASQCLELRATFRNAKTQSTCSETELSTRTERSSAATTTSQDNVPDEVNPRQAIAPIDLCNRTTTLQRWIGWSATAGLMLVMFFIDRLIASATPTFPQPRQVREQLAKLHWFLGTGPWSAWECRLLWVDALLILLFASWWMTRKLMR